MDKATFPTFRWCVVAGIRGAPKQLLCACHVFLDRLQHSREATRCGGVEVSNLPVEVKIALRGARHPILEHLVCQPFQFLEGVVALLLLALLLLACSFKPFLFKPFLFAFLLQSGVLLAVKLLQFALVGTEGVPDVGVRLGETRSIPPLQGVVIHDVG